MLMNEYTKNALIQWGCDVDTGLENHGYDENLLMLSLKKLATSYRLDDLKLTHDSHLLDSLLKDSIECGALPLSSLLSDLASEWNDDLFEVLVIEMNQLVRIV
ncbi:MAG: hypothetical protein IJ356_11215 [Erysipelotrichaceae bacterium]|nr:hypothetical protein [Erysipelotrichaceae bacterium]